MKWQLEEAFFLGLGFNTAHTLLTSASLFTSQMLLMSGL